MQPLQQPQQTREQFIDQLFQLKKEDNFLMGKEAVNKMIDGVEKGYNALKSSYGSAGGNAVIRADMYPFFEVSNDGKRILESLLLTDPYEMTGLYGMREVANRSDKESGDGRKTSALLYGAILMEGKKSKEDPMKVKKSLEDCIPVITKSLQNQSEIITVNEVGLVASIASESKELGKTFQEIYQKIGADGIIEIDHSSIPETSYEITEGVRLLNCGFTYPYMANSEDRKTCELTNPDILITKQKISTISQINHIMKHLMRNGKTEMVIFCDDIDTNVSSALASIAINGVPMDVNEREFAGMKFKTLVIKAPTLWKDWLFEDFAHITGAKIIDPAEGTNLKNLTVQQLGTCEKISTSKKETIVRGTKDISKHIQSLLDLGTDDGKIRASRLKTKTAILKLGAESDAQLSHLKGKALDGRNSAWLAMQGGIVPGGGISLVRAVKDLPDTVGGDILRKALLYPTKEICANLGIEFTDKIKPFTEIYDATIVVTNSPNSNTMIKLYSFIIALLLLAPLSTFAYTDQNMYKGKCVDMTGMTAKEIKQVWHLIRCSVA